MPSLGSISITFFKSSERSCWSSYQRFPFLPLSCSCIKVLPYFFTLFQISWCIFSFHHYFWETCTFSTLKSTLTCTFKKTLKSEKLLKNKWDNAKYPFAFFSHLIGNYKECINLKLQRMSNIAFIPLMFTQVSLSRLSMS